MTEQTAKPDRITAALVVIGEEILSGRTADKNIAHIAAILGDAGISLREVRVVPDVEAAIVEAVNALRPRFRYVFTTGGIGPTHDDITTDAIGRAFGVEVVEDARAVAALRARYPDVALSSSRLRMARIPKGAALIGNSVSGAPGFMLENVVVMAGIPRIMQAMLEDVLPRLEKGKPVVSRSIRIDAPEGDVAPGLAALQAAHPEVQIGSYPFFEKTGFGTFIVLRSVDGTRLDAAVQGLWALIGEEGFAAVEETDDRLSATTPDP
jgi:molybdenum cofactor synthesis domain-containing protein